MPKTQRSPIANQQRPAESGAPPPPCEEIKKAKGRRQKRKMLASPSSASDVASECETSSVGDLRRELKDLITEMREFRIEMSQLRESFGAVVERLESVERRVTALEQNATEGDAGRTADLERTVNQLKLELNERDQDALISDLEIGQLPEEKGENVVHAVTVLAARLGVTLEERDVVFAERVGAPPMPGERRARRVVVRLARRRQRDELLQAARVRRTVAGADGARVFLNERLTRPNRQLFHRVREECRGRQWRYSWTKRGRIYARQGDGKPAFQLRSEEDLVRVFGSKPI